MTKSHPITPPLETPSPERPKHRPQNHYGMQRCGACITPWPCRGFLTEEVARLNAEMLTEKISHINELAKVKGELLAQTNAVERLNTWKQWAESYNHVAIALTKAVPIGGLTRRQQVETLVEQRDEAQANAQQLEGDRATLQQIITTYEQTVNTEKTALLDSLNEIAAEARTQRARADQLDRWNDLLIKAIQFVIDAAPDMHDTYRDQLMNALVPPAPAISEVAIIDMAIAILEAGGGTGCPHRQPDMSGLPRFMLHAERCPACTVAKALYALKEPEAFQQIVETTIRRLNPTAKLPAS